MSSQVEDVPQLGDNAVDARFARFDIEGAGGATVWMGPDHPDIDWNDDAIMMAIGLDHDGRVTEWNHRAQELTEFTQKELVGYSFTRHLISRPLAKFVDKALKRAREGEDVGCFQIPLFAKSGHKLRIVVNVLCSSCSSSESLLLKALTTDDFARHRSAGGSATMTVHVGLDGRVKEWDTGAYQTIEFSRAEMIGKHFVDTIAPAHARAPLEDAFLQSVMGKEQQITSPVPCCTKLGAQLSLVFRTTPQFRFHRDQIAGQVTGVVFVASGSGEPTAQKHAWAATCDDLPPLLSESFDDVPSVIPGTSDHLPSSSEDGD